MARLFSTGAETGDREWNGSNSTGLSNIPQAVTDYKRSGAYSWKFSAAGSAIPWWFREVFAANKTELYGRLALFLETAHNYDCILVRFYDSQNHEQFRIQYNVGTGCLDWYDGNGALLAAGTVYVAASSWTMVEFHVTVSGSGSLILKINGTTSTTYVGDTDTTGEGDVRSVTFGAWGLVGLASTTLYMDDIAVNDTEGTYQNSWVGLGGLYYLKPDADGNQHDWTPSVGSDNFALVDETPPNTTDYVQALDAGYLDLYQVEDTPEYVDRINLVQMLYRAAVITAGYNDLQDVIRVDGTNFAGDAYTVVPLVPSFTLYRGHTHYLNPDTGAEWQVSEVDDMEGGFQIVP